MKRPYASEMDTYDHSMMDKEGQGSQRGGFRAAVLGARSSNDCCQFTYKGTLCPKTSSTVEESADLNS